VVLWCRKESEIEFGGKMNEWGREWDESRWRFVEGGYYTEELPRGVENPMLVTYTLHILRVNVMLG